MKTGIILKTNHMPKKNTPKQKISQHRILAVEGLMAVQHGSTTTHFMEKISSDLRPAVQQLLYGVLRWQGSIDHLLKKHVAKMPKKQIKYILRVAIFELFFCKTPAHACIDQAVELCRYFHQIPQTKFVNAILRKLKDEDIDRNAIVNFPEWLQKRWKDSPKWMLSLQKEPKIALAFKNEEALKTYLSFFSKNGDSASNETEYQIDINHKMGIAQNTLESIASGSITTWPRFSEGDWWIMNPASAQVVDEVWQTIHKTQKMNNVSVLDMCAAPGGKSFRFASYGANVVATDISSTRLSIFQQNCTRLNLDIPSYECDWRKPQKHIGQFDLVFLDAPCSGLGVIRKHPEIRWIRTFEDVQNHQIIQQRLLKRATQHVKANGFVAYCVCSVLPEEGSEVIESFLQQQVSKNDEPSWTLLHSWSSFSLFDNDTPYSESTVCRLDGLQVFLLQRSPFVE